MVSYALVYFFFMVGGAVGVGHQWFKIKKLVRLEEHFLGACCIDSCE